MSTLTNTLCDCQAEVFEEIATMEFPFEGIPTVPPRKDMEHMVRGLRRRRQTRKHNYQLVLICGSIC